VTNRDPLTAEIEAAFSNAPAERWLELLAEAGVPAGKVRTLDDVYAWEQTQSQGLLVEVEHPVLGPLTLPGSPLRFDDNDFSGGRRSHLPPPPLGHHDAAVRAEVDGD
jgi:crotonobetainyl-CoA:carnitine CoA-transferase CaiB-like acyl-CoA transferase